MRDCRVEEEERVECERKIGGAEVKAKRAQESITHFGAGG